MYSISMLLPVGNCDYEQLESARKWSVHSWLPFCMSRSLQCTIAHSTDLHKEILV